MTYPFIVSIMHLSGKIHVGALTFAAISCATAMLLAGSAHADHSTYYNSDTGSWRVDLGYSGTLNVGKVFAYDADNSNSPKAYMGTGYASGEEVVRTMSYSKMVIMGDASTLKVKFDECWLSAYGFCHKKVISFDSIGNSRPHVNSASYNADNGIATINASEPIKDADASKICLVGNNMFDSSITTTVCANSVSAGGKTVTASFGNPCLDDYMVRLKVEKSAIKDTWNTWNVDTYKTRQMHWYC